MVHREHVMPDQVKNYKNISRKRTGVQNQIRLSFCQEKVHVVGGKVNWYNCYGRKYGGSTFPQKKKK